MRTIGVVTGARSDYGIYLPLLRRIRDDPDLSLHLIVSGMHLSPEFGLTIDSICRDGFRIGDRVEMLLSSDTPAGIVKSMGLGAIGFAQSFCHVKPDILVVLGDRFEMYSAAFSALPFRIPVAHIHGGEITQGAIDDALRHSITKLSHLHFVATEEYARRVSQMGEESWRITVTGAPSLDNLYFMKLLTLHELENRYDLTLSTPPLLVTFHPETLDYESTRRYMAQLLRGLDAIDIPVIFTMPNADTGGRIIQIMIKEYIENRPNAYAVDNLGTLGYFSLMALSAAMVGNSSSGIIEAPSFELPVVNIGLRQHGRVRGANVIDVGHDSSEIAGGIEKAIQPEFKESLRDKANPYGNGDASEKIIKRLKEVRLDERMINKVFQDME